MIYNSTTAGGSSTTEAVVVLDFGADKTSTAGDFTKVNVLVLQEYVIPTRRND